MNQRLAIIGVGVLAVASSVVVDALTAEVAKAGSEAAAPAPTLALLTTKPMATRTHLVFATPGAGEGRIAAYFDHPADNVVRGAVMPAREVVVAVADMRNARDRSWAAALVRLQPNLPSRLLTDQVYHASRPLPVDSSHVLVQRGWAGTDPIPGDRTLRNDILSVEEVDIDTAESRTIHSWQGYETHLAGVLEREVILYRVGRAGADLVGVNLDSLTTRTIVASWPPFARDFSIDPSTSSMVVQQRDQVQGKWVVERIDLHSGREEALATSHHADMIPHVWPGGRVLHREEATLRPRWVGGDYLPLEGAAQSLWIRAHSPDHEWVAALALKAHELPSVVTVRGSDGRMLRVAVPAGERAEVAGFVGGAQ